MKLENALGVVPAVGRPLSPDERQAHLDPKFKFPMKPFDQVCTIKLNSTYLESVDVYHDWRGALSAFSLFWILFISWIFIDTVWETIHHWEMHSKNIDGIASIYIVWIVLFIPLFWLLIWMLRFDAFRLTHCPIRLNRKTRMVHFFRRDGTVASVPWDKAYFTMWQHRPPHSGILGLQCHILDDKELNVLDTFVFDYQGDDLGVTRLWEYIRTYMESGPKQALKGTSYCLPIGDKKEPPWFGFVRLMMNFNGWPLAQLLFSPLILVFSIGRAFATLTCHLPKWPKEVEDACRIECGDPYVRDWHNNPPLDLGIFFGKKEA